MATVQMPGEDSLPSNSYKSRQQQQSNAPKLKSGTAKGKVKKKSSFAELFLSEERDGIGDYVTKQVIIPRIKETVFDVVMGALSMALFDGKHAVNHNTFMRNNMTLNSRINYSGFSNGGGANTVISASSPRRSELNISEWEFDAKDDADLVFSVLCDTAIEYGSVSVAVFYQQLINLDLYKGDYDYTLQHWGWYKDTVMNAKVLPTRGGWYIDIAKAGSLR